MQTYIAHYSSPNASDVRAKGLFEFESEFRAGTKANKHDARVKMLELYGKDAVSYSIVRVERKKAATAVCDEQLELDFRTPKQKHTHTKKKEWW